MSEKKQKMQPLTKDPTQRRLMYMYDDLVSGMPKEKMRIKHEEGLYGEGGEFDADYRKVLNMYAADIEQLSSDERAKLYGRYLAVYRMAYEQGRLGDATAVLNAMAKLTGAVKDQKVSLDAGDGKVTISFGFGKEDE